MPDHTSQWLAIGLTLLTLFLLVLTVAISSRPSPQQIIYQDIFLDSNKSQVERIDVLGRLFDENPQEAIELFYTVSPTEQNKLFLELQDVEDVDEKLITVVKGIYVTIDLWDNNQDIALMEAMDQKLKKSNQPQARQLREELWHWKQGRLMAKSGQYQKAVKSYTVVLYLKNDHPMVYYDRALAYLELEQYESALDDLNEIIRIADTVPTPTPQPTNTSIPAQEGTPTFINSEPPITFASPDPSVTAEEELIPSAVVPVIQTPTTTALVQRRNSRFMNPSQIKNTVEETISANPELSMYIFSDQARVREQYSSLVNLGVIEIAEEYANNIGIFDPVPFEKFLYIGEGLTPEEFKAYVQTYNFGTNPPDFIVLHQTSIPYTLAAPAPGRSPSEAWDAGESGLSEEQIKQKRLNNLHNQKEFYRTIFVWDRGSHLWIDDRYIWLFTPMYHWGIHARQGNYYTDHNGRFHYSVGVEMVGHYGTVQPSGSLWENTKVALGTLSQRLGIPPREIKFHRDFNKPDDPGAAVEDEWVWSEVEEWIRQNPLRSVTDDNQ